MFVEQVLIAPVTTVGPRTPIEEARKLLEGRPFRHLPVVEDGALVGIVSDRDLQVALARDAAAGAEATIETVMRRDVVTVTPRTSIEDASFEMVKHKIGALPVVEGDRLVGIVTETDLLRMLLQMLRLLDPRTRMGLALRAEAALVTGAADAFGDGWPVAPLHRSG